MKTLIEIALAQYGIKEIAGAANNRTILDYAKESGFEWVNNDETPWCSIFANWVALKADLPRSLNATARSWLGVGREVHNPELGDIVVFRRGTSAWEGHVAFYINEEDGFINVLGGNQSDQVRIAAYNKANLLGYRRLSLL